MRAPAHLDDVSKARVFPPLVLDEFPGLGLLAAQLGRLLLELLSWLALKLQHRHKTASGNAASLLNRTQCTCTDLFALLLAFLWPDLAAL